MCDEAKIKRLRRAVRLSLDFETSSLLPYDRNTRTDMASMAWENEDGVVEGEGWSFDMKSTTTYNPVSWDWFAEEILRPVWNDVEKTLIFHNCKFDIQVAIRGLFSYPLEPGDVADALPKCKVHDTIIMSHLLDENTPNDLKTLARKLLKKPRKTFKQTENERKSILKHGKKLVKLHVKKGWELYWAANRNEKVMEEGLLNTEDRFAKLVYSLAPGMKKNKFLQEFLGYVEPKITERHELKASNLFARYAIDDALDTIEVFKIFHQEIQEYPEIYQWYLEVELPFSINIVEWEIGGMRIDTGFLSYLARDVYGLIQSKIKELQEEVFQKYQMEDFNPGSHDQVKNLVWERLKLKPPEWAKTTKKGLPQSSQEVMQWLAKEGHPICSKLAEVSALKTLYGNFLNPIFCKAIKDDKSIFRFSFNSLGAVTGRMSSSPNSMNIPNPDKMPVMDREKLHCLYAFLNSLLEARGLSERIPMPNGDKPPTGWLYDEEKKVYRMEPLRKVFVPRPGHLYVVADFSQIELRMIAHISQDATLLRAYRRYDCECGAYGETDVAMHKCPTCGAPDGKRDKTHPEQPVLHGFCLGLDIHSLTALNLGLFDKYGIKEGRDFSKTINFGLCYGKHWKTLVKDLGVSEDEAREMHNGYFQTYPMVKILLDSTLKRQLKETGIFPYVLKGRYRRFLGQREKLEHGIMKHWEIRQTIREIANNIPQGSAIDIGKLGVLRYTFHKRKIKELKESYVCNHIHDEVIVDALAEHIHRCAEVLVPCLEHSVKISVPILVDRKICEDWSQGKD